MPFKSDRQIDGQIILRIDVHQPDKSLQQQKELDLYLK